MKEEERTGVDTSK